MTGITLNITINGTAWIITGLPEKAVAAARQDPEADLLARKLANARPYADQPADAVLPVRVSTAGGCQPVPSAPTTPPPPKPKG